MLTLLKILLAAGALGYLGLLLMALLLAPRILFPVPLPGYALEPPFETFTDARGRTLAALYCPLPDARRVVLYHHGNGEDLAFVRARLEAFRARGYAAFAYDYPGYGRSEGRPTEASLIEAGEAAFATLQERHGWAAEHILHYGHSLGGGVALEMGARHPSAGVVVEGTFRSVFRVVTHVSLLPWDLFRNERLVARQQAPLLILHGTEDRTVPFSHGEALLRAAPAGTRHLWVEGAHHVNLWDVADEQWWDTLDAFVRSSENL
ncbi:MAG: alpha/beta hydrolase [Verrucomicrobiota bacterium]